MLMYSAAYISICSVRNPLFRIIKTLQQLLGLVITELDP